MRLHGLPATMSTAGLSEKEAKGLVADGRFLPQWGAVLQAVWLDPEALGGSQPPSSRKLRRSTRREPGLRARPCAAQPRHPRTMRAQPAA